MMGTKPGKLTIVGLVTAFIVFATGVVSMPNNRMRLIAAEDEAELSDSQRQLLKTLDQLRLPDIDKLRLVQREYHNEKDRCGFVLWQNDTKYGFLKDDFWIESYYFSDSPHAILDHDLDLVEHATKLFDDAQETKSIEFDQFMGSRSIPRKAARLPFWAWVCWRKGHHKLAGQLLSESERLYDTNPLEEFTEAENSKIMDHAEWLLERIGLTKHRQLIDRFGDLNVTRQELLSECLWFADTFPRDFHHRWIVEFIFELKRMKLEDEAHAKAARPFEQLPRHEQIAELIYQLRELNGNYRRGVWIDSSNFVGIVNMKAHEHKSTADQLVEIGYDAVPQLIEALDDQRVTRAVGDFGTYTGDVIRVSGCALAILEAITGRLLQPIEDFDAKAVTRVFTATVADRYREWYAALQQKGERQLWIEGTENGDRNSWREAKKLADKYPASAVRAIRRGNLRLESDESLIKVLADIPGDEALAALLDEVVHSSFASERILAAKAITLRGRNEGINAMLLEWADERIPRATDIPPDKESPFVDDDILNFLFHGGRVEVIEAIERQIIRNSKKKRSFLRSIDRFSYEFLPNPPREPDQDWNELLIDFTDRDPPELLSEVVENILINLLDDSETIPNMRLHHRYEGDSETSEVRNPHSKDVAIIELNRLAPERYRFTKAEFESEPIEVVLRFKNAWKKSRSTNRAEPKVEPHRTIITPADQLGSNKTAEQSKSEQQELIEATELGDPNSAAKAEELVLIYPEVAIPALQIGVIRSMVHFFVFERHASPEVSASLVALMGRVANDDSLLALLEEVECSSVVQARISAAGALLRRGRTEGLRAIIAEWNGQRFARATDRDADYRINKDRHLATFLSRCGRSDAIRELQRGLQGRSTEKRIEILTVFGEEHPPEDEREILPIVDAYTQGPVVQFSGNEASADWKSAVEAMLVALLDDTSVDQRFTEESPLKWKIVDSRGEEKEWQIAQPRVSDIASIILRALNPDHYLFSDTDFTDNREPVRINLKKRGRKAHGQELLPVPEP